MDFFAWMHIAFTVELSSPDLFLKTVHRVHANERIPRRCDLFLLPISQFCRNVSFSRKAILPRHAKQDSGTIGAASTLLATASTPSSIRRDLGRCLVCASFWCGACTHASGFCSRSVQASRLNPSATRALGVLWGINHQQWSVRSVALACPHRSLEDLLFATQKTCLRES